MSINNNDFCSDSLNLPARLLYHPAQCPYPNSRWYFHGQYCMQKAAALIATSPSSSSSFDSLISDVVDDGGKVCQKSVSMMY